MVVSKSVPFKPVMQKLADVTGISRNDIPDYLIYMERAGMISQLRNATGGLRGPKQIVIDQFVQEKTLLLLSTRFS